MITLLGWCKYINTVEHKNHYINLVNHYSEVEQLIGLNLNAFKQGHAV